MHSVFHSGDYRRLWFSSVFSSMSVGGDYVLLGWFALSVTQSASWVGMAFAVYYIPMLLFGVPAGSVADRFGRFRLLRLLELLAFASLLILSFAFWFFGQSMVNVFLLPLLLGSVRATYHPTRLSYSYDLTGGEHATASLAGISIASRIGMIPGAIAVGMLTQDYGAGIACIFMGCASMAAFLVLGQKDPVASTQVVDTSPILENLKHSLLEVRRNNLLFVLILITALIEIFGVSFITVLPSLEQERLEIGVKALGWMNASQAAGGFVAAVVIFLVPGKHRSGTAFFCSIALLGASVVLLGAVTQLTPILLVLALISATIVVWDILTQVMMQRAVPEHLRGRAMGAWVVAIGSAPLGHLEIGFLATIIGVDMALYGNGIGAVVVAAIFFFLYPALRKL